MMFVAKIKASEKFIFITLADDFSSIIQTSEPMTEGDLRASLRNTGMPELEVNDHIEHAKKYPF
jgi:hypothetical protein